MMMMMMMMMMILVISWIELSKLWIDPNVKCLKQFCKYTYISVFYLLSLEISAFRCRFLKNHKSTSHTLASLVTVTKVTSEINSASRLEFLQTLPTRTLFAAVVSGLSDPWDNQIFEVTLDGSHHLCQALTFVSYLSQWPWRRGGGCVLDLSVVGALRPVS